MNIILILVGVNDVWGGISSNMLLAVRTSRRGVAIS